MTSEMGHLNLDDILITEELSHRSPRSPDLKAENAALRTLARQLLEQPQTMLKTLVTLAKDLCQAGTAGVSLLESTSSGEAIFRWVAIAGALERYEQGTIPCHFSPCGVCLERQSPQLYTYPARHFTELQFIDPQIVEGLAIPLMADGEPLGVIWIVSHDAQRQFDAEDVRVMTSLADFTATALYNDQIRQSLQQREAELRVVTNTVPVLISFVDREQRYRFNNRTYEEWFGQSAAAVYGKTLWEVLGESAYRTLRPYVEQVLSGELVTFESEVPYQDGGRRYVQATYVPRFDSQATVEGFVALVSDISERKQAEAALRQGEERLRIAQQAARAGVWDWDVLTNQVTWSEEYYQLYGLDPATTQPSYENWLAAILEPDRAHADRAARESLEHQTNLNVEFRILHPTQGERWITAMGQTFYDANHRPIRMTGIALDTTDRKRAEEALRQSEFKYQTLVKNMPGMIYRYVPNPQGKDSFTYVSSGSRQLFELAPETILQDANALWSLVHPEDLPSLQSSVNTAIVNSTDWQWEGRIITPSGQLKWIQGKSRVEETEHGKVWDGLLIDISDRKQAELEREQLLTRERHYINQLQGLTTAALTINSALSVEQVLQLITDQAAAIIGAHQSVTSMALNQNWAQAITAVYLSDKYAQWRGYDEKPDGSGIYACVCHLNQPMRLTQAELESHPRWQGFGQAVANHPPMRGWLAAPLVGREGQNIGLIQLSDKYEGEFSETDEVILVQLAQMASVAVENARLYEAERQTRAAAEASREEAQAANRIKDEFLAVLSHELRSPLNPILGWVKLLRNRKLNAEKTTEALASIERNAKLQAELIEDLLDVSRILRGKLSLNMVPVDLKSTIAAAMDTVRLAADAKRIELHFTVSTGVDATPSPPRLLQVMGDAGRLQQVVWNLLSNAVKFTPEGGRVEVRLEGEGGDAAREPRQTRGEGKAGSASPSSPYARITVTDTGKGIAPEFLPYVFDYFRQEDGTTTRRFGGLGLGLAIVRYLVELHGGTVQVASPGAGQGATFTVRLPLLKSEETVRERKAAPRASALSHSLAGLRILVVDDDADTRNLIVFLLQQAGAAVTAVASASEAFALLTQAKLDLLLSDIGMPDIDGYMLLRQVRALPPEQGGTIPAIALTAYAGEINQQRAAAAGFQGHIAKPVEPEALIQAITALNPRPLPLISETG
nr:MAG: PAS domain S-box protein [Leptolyngbya sp. IPPAS B-1204]